MQGCADEKLREPCATKVVGGRKMRGSVLTAEPALAGRGRGLISGIDGGAEQIV